MNFKKITIVALAMVLLFSTNAFAWKLTGATIEWVRQEGDGTITIRYDSNRGYFSNKIVNAPGYEKNFLAIALTAQASGLNVNIEIDGIYITMIEITTE